MKRAALLSLVALSAAAAVALSAPVFDGLAGQPAEPRAAGDCPAPAKAPRYPEVEPIFRRHCASCHDAAKSDNRAAQRVFEMTRYPFSTARPTTLLADLGGMFANRGSLSAAEKCAGTVWIKAGALDAEGRPPRWVRAP